jgi:hypothetical protein
MHEHIILLYKIRPIDCGLKGKYLNSNVTSRILKILGSELQPLRRKSSLPYILVILAATGPVGSSGNTSDLHSGSAHFDSLK